jgi:hypothetical protein
MYELLHLCGFEDHEIELHLPRIEIAFEKLGITEEDVERGKQRLQKYYDIDLNGVRKALRLHVLEVVDAVLARQEGKKVIYGFMSVGLDMIGAALMYNSKALYSGRIEFTFSLVLGCIFDKLVPVLEAAEKKWLKAGGVTHCGNIKITTGLLDLNMIPRPDLMVSTGFACETAPKTLFLLHDFYDIPVCYFDTCHDTSFIEDTHLEKRTLYFAENSLKKLMTIVEQSVGFEISGDMLQEVLNAKSDLANARSKLTELIENSDPLVLRPATDTIVGGLSPYIARLPEVIQAINITCKELQVRVDKGIGVVKKGAPRVISPLPMHTSDPRMEHLLTEMDIALLPQSGIRRFTPPISGSKDLNPHFEVLKGVMPGIIKGRLAQITEDCKKRKVNGLLDRFNAGCRGMVAEAILIKEAVEKEVGIPVLLMEWENFDPRVYNHDEYMRRFEVFKSMMIN